MRVREPSLVVLAVDRSGDNPAPVVLLYVCEVGSDDVIAHALLIGPALDGGGTPELPLDVVQQAVVGERGDHAVAIEGVGRGEEVADGLGTVVGSVSGMVMVLSVGAAVPMVGGLDGDDHLPDLV